MYSYYLECFKTQGGFFVRQIVNINQKWAFAQQTNKIPTAIDETWNIVNLPHSWNAIDGQDGGNDYFRGTCSYTKKLSMEELPAGDRIFLEINGANSSADVYFNGKHLAHHDGGYSTWRVELTDCIVEENLLTVLVDNSPNERVYPQTADFTFYGGLYRNVNLIAVSDAHFTLTNYGGTGIYVTPVMEGTDARVHVRTEITNAKTGDTVHFTILDREGSVVE